MALRTVAATQYRLAQSTATNLASYLKTLRDNLAAGPVSGNTVIALFDRLLDAKAIFGAIAATPDIVAFARNYENDIDYNVASEFSAMTAALTALGNFVATTTPTDNWITFSATGIATRSFSAAQTASLRAQIDTVLATIE